MSSIEIRAFARRDRDQLTHLVNAHAAAVVPGQGVSVAAMLNQLEREPGEFIVDPWVSDRVTLVAEQHDRIAAAALLLRYADKERVGPAYRGAGEIRWLLFWPEGPRQDNPYWTDATAAADWLIAACVRQFADWRVTSQHAGGELPVPGVYGVPEQWPHVRALYERAGFVQQGHTELVYLAKVEDLVGYTEPPLPGMEIRRSVGLSGTRLAAILDGERTGFIEVEILDNGERLSHRGWADIGNLYVAERYRRRGVATWLLSHAASWLLLARVDRLLGYVIAGEEDNEQAFLTASGFTELTRTRRGWTRGQRTVTEADG